MSRRLTKHAGAVALAIALLAAPRPGASQRLTLGPVVLRHASPVLDVAFAPDGKVLATTSRNEPVIIWDTATGRRLRTLASATRPGSVAFSPDGMSLAVSELSGAVVLWNTQTWTPTTGSLIPATDPGPGLAFGRIPARKAKTGIVSGGGRIVLAAWARGAARVFDVTAGPATVPLYVLKCSDTPPDPMDPYTPSMHSVQFARNGLSVVSVCDHRVTMWDAVTGAQQLIVPAPLVAAAALSLDSRLLALVRHDAPNAPQVQVRVLAQSTEYTFPPPPPLPSPGFHATAFSPDGSALAGGQWQTGTIVLWNVATRAVKKTLTGHTNYVTRLAFSPDGSLLASGGGIDSTVRLWRMR